jgi:3-deoxy-D-manno-octulosonic-acid transferase
MVRLLLDIVYVLLMVLLAPWILYRMFAQKRYRVGWKERLGVVPVRFTDQPCIWIHAVSMGEINAIGTLIEEIHRSLPQFEIVISSTTDTGISRAKKLYGTSHRVFFFPLDFSQVVKKALNRLHPQLCIMMELEVWPNFMSETARQGVPVMVVNGRISSAKGFPRYRRIAPLVRPIFRRLTMALVQDETYAERFRYLGVLPERVQVAGSLKYDTAELGDTVVGSDELAGQLGLKNNEPVWVAGSTGPGEEEIILNSFSQLRRKKELQQTRLVIVPRKPERFDEVARLIESHGCQLIRYSRVKAGKHKVSDRDDRAVILGDTMGDLRKFYSLASVVFVGRSLVPMGGSDMIEAAGLAKPVIVGPYTENFIDSMKKLEAAEGIKVVADGLQLTEVTENLLRDTASARQMGQRARQVIIENRGATRRTVEAVAKLLCNA